MTRSSFNADWSVRPKTSIFAELQGAGSHGRPVVLPHDALFDLNRGPDAEGGHNAYFPSAAFEYTKQFDVPEAWRAKRVSVEFQAVYRDAMVYVNGVYAAQRPNGYTGFTVALDPYLRYGQRNTIRVDARAHQDSRWYSGVGIHRDTVLIISEPVHLADDGIRITTPDIETDTALVVVATTVANESMHTTTVELETRILDPDGIEVGGDSVPVTVRAGQRATIRQRLLVHDPRLWDVDSPTLYMVRTGLAELGTEIDDRSTSFGLRRVQVDPERGLRINGRTVNLRGACIHSDNGLLGAAAFGRAEGRRIELLKAAGFNAVRSSHNPISPAMLDACDRLGMLVMDETFDMWAESKSPFDYSLAFPEWWERDIEAMVSKDFNHPSVIFYSIGNEIPETGTPLGAELGRRMAEKIRAVDPTRLVTNGINGFVAVLPDVVASMSQRVDAGNGGVNDLMGSAGDLMNQVSASPLVTERTAESFSVLDVAGINYGEARYGLDADQFPNRVIVGTETFPNNIDVNWALVKQHHHVIGDFTWTGWDYLGEVGIGRVRYADEEASFAAPYPWMTAWCGDLDITGHRRPQSYYREIVFGLRHEPYIAALRPENHGRTDVPGQWSWSDALPSWTWNTPEGSPMKIEVYSDAAEVELVVNDTVIGRAPTGPEHRYRATFDTAYVPGRVTAIAYDSDGQETGRTELATAGPDTRLTAVTDRDVLVADHSDLAYIAIELRDRDGVLVNTADAPVNVTVAGPAVLAGLGSARPDNTERYDQDTHKTFDGRLLAIVRPTGVGDIRVTATASTYEPVEVALSAVADVAAADPVTV